MILFICLLYRVFALSGTVQAVSTAPIEPLLSAADGNRTTLNTQISPPWVSTAGEIGTSDILWSCLLTLTACVYTAIHLNVPPAHEGRRQFFWRKAKWVALALFAPEIVLYCALTQLLEARKFIKEMNELWDAQQISLDHPERQESALAPSDASDSCSKDDFNVAEQGHLGPHTQQDQAPSEISPLPLPKSFVRESEETKKDDDTLPISGDDAEDQTCNQGPQKSLSISSKRIADGQLNSKGHDLEKGAVSI